MIAPKSLRWRLVLSLVIGISAVFGAGGWLAFRLIAANLYAQFDQVLLNRAKAIISMIETEAGFVDFEWMESGLSHPAGHDEGKEAFQIWASGDRVLAKTPALGEAGMPRGQGTLESPQTGSFRMPGDDDRWRFSSVRFVAAADPEASAEMDAAHLAKLTAAGYVRLEEPAAMELALARWDSVHPALYSIRRVIFLLWAAVSLMMAGIVFLLVRQNMRPLDTLRNEIGRLDSDDPKGRVVLNNAPVELEPVVGELNRLLDRVGRSLQRERSLTSNVAHELRTPIAGLLATLEVTLGRERNAEEYREAGADCLEIVKRMNWLVNNLLSIARLEAGHVELHDHIVELRESLQAWWRPFEEAAAEKHLHVVWQVAEHEKIKTDPEFLRVIVSNLFDNAVSYTVGGGLITIGAREGRITVGNDVLDLSPEIATRVFEPLWRNAEAREESGLHVGLGLSLCRKIIQILGGKIDVALPGAGSRFEVSLQFSH